MKLRIVRTDRSGLYESRYAQYRGLDRSGPTYVQHLSASHPANEAFYRYCEESALHGYLNDESLAKSLVQIYAEFDVNQPLEIVEFYSTTEMPAGTTAQFLGYDLVTNNLAFSYLANGMLDESTEIADQMTESERLEEAIVAVTASYIRHRRNDNGLLQSAEDALVCAECLGVLRESKEMGGVHAVAVYRHAE